MADSSGVRSIRQSVRLGDARDIFLNTIVSPNTRRAYRTALTALVDGVLKAMRDLADLLASYRGRGLPARWLDARKVDHDLVSGGWSRLVYPDGRPEKTVDRAAYTLCVLERFHRHLKYRNIFAEHSSKWRDPRTHLLSGMAWKRSATAA